MSVASPRLPSHLSTVGRELERRRLEHRARRLELVIAALHDRERAVGDDQQVPRGLRRSIADFSSELSQVKRRLGGMGERPAR